MAQLRTPFRSGYWIWDDYEKGLSFVSQEPISQKTELQKKGSTTAMTSKITNTDIQFREDVGLMDKIRFRKLYQRRIDLDEPEVIILQDVKDVAFFTANPKDLTIEIIEFLHTQIVDRLIKSFIVYFQYYLQVWDKLMHRREEKKNKLTQPIVTTIENLIREDLSELRSMVSCQHGAIIIGAAESQKFHHLANKNGASLSGRDRRVFNLTMKMVLRIIWLALQRPNIALIELELTRLVSSDSFNTFVHHGKKTKKLQTTKAEDRILQGVANVREPRLLQRSPLGKEILIGNHDHRVLSIGIVSFPPSDERLRFLQAAYTAPEVLLSEMGITLGVLGLKRSDFDEMLVKRKIKKKKKDEESVVTDDVEEEPEFAFTFIIPEEFIHSDDAIPDAYPTDPPKYVNSEYTKQMIKQQCEMWKDRVINAHLGIPTPSISSYAS